MRDDGYNRDAMRRRYTPNLIFSSCSEAVSHLVWDQRIAGSNPAS